MYLMFVLLCILARNMTQCTVVHTEKWQDMELPCVQSTLDVREFSKNQSFTYMIKIYVLKYENGQLKMSAMYSIYLHSISYCCQKWPLNCEAFK